MKVKKIISNSSRDLPEIAKSILALISPSKPLLLNGEIGSGKTTLVKYIAKELKIKEIVNSPTFVIMKTYRNLVHIDAYRITGNLDEYEEFFTNKYLIIEWSDNLKLNFNHYLKINVYSDGNKHIYEIVGDK